MSNIIVKKAIELASDSIMMDSYKDFFKGKGYFLTKNNQLSGAERKPSRFPDTNKNFAQKWVDSNWFTDSQRKYMLFLAGITDFSTVKDSDYTKLKQAYNKWDGRYYVVFYGGGISWTCNLFVGEALFWAGENIINFGRYYSARQIWNCEGRFTKISENEVEIGDVVAFGGYHVEIVTRIIEKGIFFKDKISFCSLGAGSGSGQIGIEKCGGQQRLINSGRIKFLRI